MGRYPKCKTCANILACENGSHFCRERGEETTPERSFACETYASSKRKKTKEEISLIRSMAGKAGAAARGSGWGNGGTPTSAMRVRKIDYDVFSKFAAKQRLSMTELFHNMCVAIAQKNPDLANNSDLPS